MHCIPGITSTLIPCCCRKSISSPPLPNTYMKERKKEKREKIMTLWISNNDAILILQFKYQKKTVATVTLSWITVTYWSNRLREIIQKWHKEHTKGSPPFNRTTFTPTSAKLSSNWCISSYTNTLQSVSRQLINRYKQKIQ